MDRTEIILTFVEFLVLKDKRIRFRVRPSEFDYNHSNKIDRNTP